MCKNLCLPLLYRTSCYVWKLWKHCYFVQHHCHGGHGGDAHDDVCGYGSESDGDDVGVMTSTVFSYESHYDHLINPYSFGLQMVTKDTDMRFITLISDHDHHCDC